MQKGDRKDRKMATSVEIVDVPPVTNNESILKADDLLVGATNLSKEEVHHLFQFRNLAFLVLCQKMVPLMSLQSGQKWSMI